MIGLCTGLLAASAASTLSSPASFVPLAVETVRVAFRVGVHVESVADRLRTRGDGAENWSIIVSGITDAVAEKALEDFHSETVRKYSIPATLMKRLIDVIVNLFPKACLH